MKTKTVLYTLSLIIVFGLVLAGQKTDSHICHQPYRYDTTMLTDKYRIEVELAANSKQRTQGLSGRECIAMQQGMLFVYGKAGYHPIWMKDMNFPIDIVWLTKEGVPTDLFTNVKPSTYPATFTNTIPGNYVLELPDGRAKQLDIQIGKPLKF